MKASEARRLTDLVQTMKKMGDLFGQIKAAAERGESKLVVKRPRLPQLHVMVLKDLGYKVWDDNWKDEYDTWHGGDYHIEW